MKTTLIIETNDYANLNEVLDKIRAMEGVIQVTVEDSFPMMALEEAVTYDTKPVQTAYRPGLPTTYEELLEDLRWAVEDAKAGRVTSHEDFKKEMETW